MNWKNIIAFAFSLLVSALLLGADRAYSSFPLQKYANSNCSIENNDSKSFNKSINKPFIDHGQEKIKVRYKGSEVKYDLNVFTFTLNLYAGSSQKLTYGELQFFAFYYAHPTFNLRGPPALV